MVFLKVFRRLEFVLKELEEFRIADNDTDMSWVELILRSYGLVAY